MSRRLRRTSSEYSASSVSISEVSQREAIRVDDQEKKQARGHLYAVLFREPVAIAGIFPSLIFGATPIVMYVVFGKILNKMTYYNLGLIGKPTQDIMYLSLYLLIVAVVSGVCKFFDALLWIRAGANLSTKIRRNLFNTMMRSEVAFFDVNPIGGILTLLSEDSQLVQEAFGTTKGTQVSNLSQFVVGILMAFIYSWKLALVATASIPVIAIVLVCFMPGIIKNATAKFQCVAQSMTIAEETLAAIRTVKGVNKEDWEISRFVKCTEKSAVHEKKIGLMIACMMSLVMLVIWGMVSGNLYFGATLVKKGELESGDLFSVFGFSMFGCFGLIMLQGSMQGEEKAIAAGARILKLTNHTPALPFEGGDELDPFLGHIVFDHVSFKYPTRDTYVLRDVSFEIKPGQMGALVGHSGSGKSTCVQLLERFYDVTEGVITIDGKDINEIDPRWLHRRTALVSQEPILFQLSIKDNIKYGKRDATDDEVMAAAEVANCRKFVEKLTHGFDEMVGEKGAQLSGGQRQRVAIARAVIKDPVILITDEATSALDADSEKKVQMALDKVMKDRTAVIVAHRLSTIKNAHIIYVFDSGEIKESGVHAELVEKRGCYYNLVSRQLNEEEKSRAGPKDSFTIDSET